MSKILKRYIQKFEAEGQVVQPEEEQVVQPEEEQKKGFLHTSAVVVKGGRHFTINANGIDAVKKKALEMGAEIISIST